MPPTGDHRSAVSSADIKPFLTDCGYRGGLLHSRFKLSENLTVPLVGFAHRPVDVRSACIAVLDADEGSPELVEKYRSLAAPVVLVCGRRGLEWWEQSPRSPILAKPPISPERMPQFFAEHASEFSPSAIYRAKTWGRFDKKHQRSFVDLGLMPMVEHRIGEDLTRLVETNVQRLKSRLGWETLSEKQGQWLLTSAFWLLSAKILSDKAVRPMADLDFSDAESVLEAVATHYGARPISIAGKQQRAALSEISSEISKCSSLQLATTESLAHVYENTLISKATRQSLGTHSTPSYLVDYVLGRLAPWMEEIPLEQRNVFEPACGHAAFLVSAMRMLTELLPEDRSSAAQRRSYLRKRIHGCDIDAFTLEIARLSLSLTDIPNPNGWDLTAGDMFLSDELEAKSRDATILLANPPFENFSPADREWYVKKGFDLRHVNKTAEMLSRVLPALPEGAVVGLVVPEGFLHSKNAIDVRRQIVDGFEFEEICVFPDKLFTFSDSESAVLIARKQVGKCPSILRYRRVRERDVDLFRTEYRATSSTQVDKSKFCPTYDLRIPDLAELWEVCHSFGRLGDISEIGQGFTFRGKDLPRDVVTYSDREFPSAVSGFLNPGRSIGLHELPETVWFNFNKNVVRRSGHGRIQGVPQVIVNEAPSSRGPWRLKGLIDSAGHPVSGRFNVVRPRQPTEVPLEFLWAICNSPLANAFAYCHSGKRHNDSGMLRQIPVPNASAGQVRAVCDAARGYLDSVRGISATGTIPFHPAKVGDLLLRVDEELLKLYSLPRELEWQLLNLFSGWTRGGLPFPFEGYFPPHFRDPISLADYLAITSEWQQTNQRRGELVRKKVARKISDNELKELDHLQSLASSRVELLAPLPLKELEEVHRRVVGESRP